MRLDQYAGVCAAIGTGFPLPAALENDGLDTRVWMRAAPAWAAKLAAQSPGDLLRRAYAQKLNEADAWLGRQIKPMDEDMESWLGFLGAWSVDPAPLSFLSRLRLIASDVTRLQRGWSQRLATDQALRKKTLTLAARRPTRLPSVRIVPARLRPFPWSSPRTRQLANGPSRATAAIAELSAGPVAVALATPSFLLARPSVLPMPAARRADPTTLAFTLPGRATLPFAPAPAPVPELTMEQHASLCAEIALAPGRLTDILQRYRIAPQARERLDRHYADLFASCPEARIAWEHAYRTYEEWLSSNPRRCG